MKNHLFGKLNSWIILTGFVIFFMCCCGCLNDSSASGGTVPPLSTSMVMPTQTSIVMPAVTSGKTPFLPETSPGTSTQSMGSLIIWSSPPACSVYIDGMYVGDTPLGQESFTKSVKSGPHTVKITKIGYADYTQNVYVSAGKAEIVTATLSEKPFPYYTLNPTSTFTEPFSST
jgi:hypothetical protein